MSSLVVMDIIHVVNASLTMFTVVNSCYLCWYFGWRDL